MDQWNIKNEVAADFLTEDEESERIMDQK